MSERYRIVARGDAGGSWNEQLGGLAITPLPDGSLALGPVVGNPALLNVLERIRELNGVVLLVSRL